MKCPGCGYANKPDAVSCNLCHGVLKKERPTQRVAGPTPKKHLLIRAGAPFIELEPGTLFTIGRQSSCSLPIPSTRVSRLHAEIRWEEGRPVLADKGSSNGTFVGGQRIDVRALEPGDEVEIGPFHCTYRFGDPKSLEPSEDSMEGTAMLRPGGDFLSGQIENGGLIELLQSLEFNRKTGTVDVRSGGESGWLTVQKGAPLAAETKTLRDEEAVQRLLSFTAGRFVFLAELKTTERRMKTTLTAILLEAGRRADEKQLETTDGS